MLRKFCRWLLYRRMGWTARVTVDLPEKFIVCLAPHTSNVDFLIGQLYGRAEGLGCGFLMKKEWFFWPLGPVFRRMGGVPVCRDRHTSLTARLAATARETPRFRLCVTPEGTRRLTTEWRKGFYYIALGAGIPILLYGLDFERRLIECTRAVMPTGDAEADMREIKRYFRGYRGKHPDQFATGEEAAG